MVLDALCQGIESWWSINSSQLSQSYSSYAVRTLIQNIEPYIFGNNSDAAALVMSAANKAGQAINITQTTAPHAFSYKLTSLYHLPHGHRLRFGDSCFLTLTNALIPAAGNSCTTFSPKFPMQWDAQAFPRPSLLSNPYLENLISTTLYPTTDKKILTSYPIP